MMNGDMEAASVCKWDGCGCRSRLGDIIFKLFSFVTSGRASVALSYTIQHAKNWPESIILFERPEYLNARFLLTNRLCGEKCRKSPLCVDVIALDMDILKYFLVSRGESSVLYHFPHLNVPH